MRKIAINPYKNTPLKDIYKIVLDDDNPLNRDQLHSITEVLLNDYRWSTQDLLEEIAEKEDIYPDTLDLIITHAPYLKVIAKAVRNPKTSLETLRNVVEDENFDEEEDIMYGVALNPNIDDYIKDIILKHESEEVRLGLVYNPKLSKLDWDLLSEDEDNYIREQVAANKNAPLFVLKKLLDDKEISVVREVLRNPSFPLEDVKELATSGTEKQLTAIITGLYGRDPEFEKTLQLEVIESGNKELIQTLAETPGLDNEVLERITDTDYFIALGRVVETNKNLSSELLLKITKRLSELYFKKVSPLSYTSLILERIIYKANTDSTVLAAMAYSKLFNKLIGEDDQVKLLVNIFKNKYLRPDSLEHLYFTMDESFLEFPKVLEAVADNGKSSAKVLEDLFDKSTNKWDLIAKITVNPNCPEDLKEKYRRYLSRRMIDDLNSQKLKGKKIPKVDWEDTYHQPVKSKTNQDLELLQRLKGHLK